MPYNRFRRSGRSVKLIPVSICFSPEPAFSSRAPARSAFERDTAGGRFSPTLKSGVLAMDVYAFAGSTCLDVLNSSNEDLLWDLRTLFGETMRLSSGRREMVRARFLS